MSTITNIRTNSKTTPFPITTGKMNNINHLQKLRKEIEILKKTGERYSTTKKLFKDLNK